MGHLANRFVKCGVAFAAFSMIALPAKAGLLLEPYLGYQAVGSFEHSTGGTKQSSDQNGVAIGGRVGYSLPLVFWVGLDGRQTTGKVKGTAGGASDGDMTETQVGAMVGAHLPLLQAYAGYLFMNDLKAKDSTSEATFKGSGVKLGVGFTGLPFVSLNAEYVISTYDKLTSSGVDTTLTGGKGNSLTLSVSAPFDF